MGLFSASSGIDFFGSVISECYTRSEVPGRTIEKSLGLVQYTKKGIAGDDRKGFSSDVINQIDDIFQSLLQIARKTGANAVVNVRIATGPYQMQGSEWVVTYIVAYGEAVILTSL